MTEQADEMAGNRVNELQRLRQRFGQLEIEINNLISIMVCGLSSAVGKERFHVAEKEKRRVSVEIITTESSHPFYPMLEEQMEHLATNRETLLSLEASRSRVFV